MTNQPAKRRTSPFIVWPVSLFFLLSMYVVSYGPVLGLYSRGMISVPAFLFLYRSVYFPIQWTNDNTDFLRDNRIGQEYVRYLEWWWA